MDQQHQHESLSQQVGFVPSLPIPPKLNASWQLNIHHKQQMQEEKLRLQQEKRQIQQEKLQLQQEKQQLQIQHMRQLQHLQKQKRKLESVNKPGSKKGVPRGSYRKRYTPIEPSTNRTRKIAIEKNQEMNHSVSDINDSEFCGYDTDTTNTTNATTCAESVASSASTYNYHEVGKVTRKRRQYNVSRPAFTKYEDTLLLRFMKDENRSMRSIALEWQSHVNEPYIVSRTHHQLGARALYLDPRYDNSELRNDEKAQIIELAGKNGTKNWDFIASYLHRRSTTQVRKFYYNYDRTVQRQILSAIGKITKAVNPFAVSANDVPPKSTDDSSNQNTLSIEELKKMSEHVKSITPSFTSPKRDHVKINGKPIMRTDYILPGSGTTAIIPIIPGSECVKNSNQILESDIDMLPYAGDTHLERSFCVDRADCHC